MFRKILVATRNPAESDAAVLSAARIAEYNQALLTLLHVIEPLNGIETKVARHFETGEIINLDAAGSYLQEVREKLYKNYRMTPLWVPHFLQLEFSSKPFRTVQYPWRSISKFLHSWQ